VLFNISASIIYIYSIRNIFGEELFRYILLLLLLLIELFISRIFIFLMSYIPEKKTPKSLENHRIKIKRIVLFIIENKT
jgi:hypothetical protein